MSKISDMHVLYDASGRPRQYSDEANAAFRLVEGMLKEGVVDLKRDTWRGRELIFLAPHRKQPSAISPA